MGICLSCNEADQSLDRQTVLNSLNPSATELKVNMPYVLDKYQGTSKIETSVYIQPIYKQSYTNVKLNLSGRYKNLSPSRLSNTPILNYLKKRSSID